MPLDTLTENEIYPILSRATTKQTMFSRPPDALIIHLSRSSYYAGGMILKNDCRVTFPEILILDRFTTTPELCRRAEAPISKLGPTRSDPQYVFRRMRGKAGWYQISDDDVQPCSAREALSANPTILMYQRLGHDNLMMKGSG
ncbi:hypothetical protein CROQUDRAFT_657538 [Cronartium quercuum f. sp. fusiforme G11]|uniref:ubiquitinyl hydrolase 1 n=1 Tax=Cronartium quercuum f. sp. fusiforme G11 TaxID=708437 RepID=A0A9P6NMV7_9BASI|nr:hypothetical protein CROQUDRAFT_657538 [Cronartium quercuum f. sp. fusiforme G11]